VALRWHLNVYRCAEMRWVCVTVYLKWTETKCSACRRMGGGIPCSSIIICDAVKQCSLRWRELMRALWACCTCVGGGEVSEVLGSV